ncbi:MAG TPA: tetratricopeptide repeat protein, partial [Enhygromyxa sp.]|nr:tetratricopeptide repeat protein [Enhygromyxa sp.]
MNSDEPPEFESDERPDAEALDDGMGPGVGNVLGFSLLFRERRALLALNRRSLAPGVRLRDYEAVIPGVRFPLRGPLNATKFRKHRCRVVRAILAVEDRALRPWLHERLVGQQLLGVTIGELELDLRRELPEAEQPRPCLMISGTTSDGGQIWLLVAFDVEPVHRLLLLRPCRLWLVGNLQLGHEQGPSEYGGAEASIDRHGRDASARRLWSAIARRLAGRAVAGIGSGLQVGDDGVLTIDAGRLAMTRPFASVGWKAPNLEGCAVEGLALTRRGLTLELRGPLTEGEPGEESELGDEWTTPPAEPPASVAARAAVAALPGEPGLLEEPIARGLDRARELLRASRVEGGDVRPALERLAELSRELGDFPAAHLALVRWRVELSRFLDREACIEAVHEWLDLQPSASEPRRLLAILLAASDRAQELARLLASECRQPHEPVTQARLELAVARLLIDRLEDPRSALTIVAPLTQRLRELIGARRDRRSGRRGLGGDDGDLAALRELLPEALVVLARARVAEVAREGRSLATVPHVLEALDEALEATRNPRRRADLRAAVADSFARYGGEHGDDRRGDLQALALLEAAIADDPEHDELLDRAIEIAARTDERATAAQLLRARLSRAQPHERASLRKRLIAVAAELDDREHRELARRELAIALEQEPDNVVLLRRAATLERKLGDARAAAEFVGRLLELDEAGEIELDDRDVLVLDRARLLRRAGQIDEAWEHLRPALDSVGVAAGSRNTSPKMLRSSGPEGSPLGREWILDVIELALELAPPTDRPRILDRLIDHASGQRRGEALVERAAQALRVDERLADLWAAVDELEAPQKILAQIEQLLDDRDERGLLRLAEVASSLRERITELHARARLGQTLLDEGEVDEAARQLERAVELGPDRLDLRHALAEAYERSERVDQAIPLLRALLRDDREATPDDRGQLVLRLASLLRAVGASEEAAELLASCERELARADPELVSEAVREAVADQSFAALRELAEDDRALTVALEQAAILWPLAAEVNATPELARRLGAWLARAARVLDEPDVETIAELGASVQLPDALPRTRVQLLERAVELRPDDHELADWLEAVLRERGDVEGLQAQLRRRIDRNADPELRAGLLERLIASVEASLAGVTDRRRASELAELLEDLLVLRPEHTSAMLTLGRLRFEAGELTDARQLWALAEQRLERDDPRFYRPAIELARAAIEDGELTLARELAERARELEPREEEPLLLLGGIARELDDPALAVAVLRERLALEDEDEAEASARASLELELALALADCFDRFGDRDSAAAAIEHFAAAEQLLPARAAAQDRRAALERWLALALALGDLEQQARARAALRESLGVELDVAALVAEIELLDRGLDRPLAAFERCEWALAEHAADPALVDALARLLAHRDAPELAERSQRLLRAVMKDVRASEGRTRAAELLIELGARLDDPASVAFGLDQLAPERVEHGELARLRDWAVRKLGRVHEEIGSVESRLASGGLASERRQALCERLLALHDHDRVRTAARLLELAEQAEREVAALLAEEALILLEPTLDDAEQRGDQRLLELGIDGLRKLARYGHVEAVVRRWPLLELAVRDGVEAGAGLRPLAHLVEFAVATEHPELGERADALLAERLPDHPDDTRLLRGLWSRSSGEVLLQEGERGRTTIVARAAAWLEDLIHRKELDARTAALLFDGLASLVVVELDEQAAATLLRQRAEAHVRDTELFAALLQLLEARRRWPEMLSLLARAAELELPPADRPDAWLAIAEAAERDGDELSEARARERAGELLFERERERDEQAAARAIEQLGRALELEPDHAALRWRLGLALHELGRAREAFEHLLVIWEREQWSQAGIEIGELALRSGELAAQLGELQRAVELLSTAHARAGAEQRERATEGLFAALLALDRREEAVSLASARASELQPDGAVGWLRRAAALAEGLRKVELLTRACQLAPSDAQLSEELEQELRELGDLDALEGLLRERIDRCAAGGRAAAGAAPEDLDPALRESWIAAIEALVELLGHDRARELDEQDEALADADRQAEIVALHEQLLALAPEHAEALLIVAAEYHRRERNDDALALWARAEPLLGDDDPRLFEVARRLADRRASDRQLAEAHRLLERALQLRPDDLDALEQRHALACALDRPELVLTAARALLEQSAELDGPRIAELHGDVARAHTLLGEPEAAIAAIERAVEHVEVGSALHRTLVERWLELLTRVDARDPLVAARRELAARTELRRALGSSLDRAESLREWDLLVTLGELDRASELLELLLIAAPDSEDLRARLRGLDSERGLRSLRRVVDALAPGSIRDELARELARNSRALEAARTTLDALDRLSGQVAAEPEMLDLRVWAVRKLDRVEDELRELDSLLARAGSGEDPSADGTLLDRLLRVLEHDIDACATRLIELATGTPAPAVRAQVWLLESALTLLREHAPERTALGVRALAALLDRIGDAELLVEIDHDERAARERVAEARRSWQQLAAAALAHAGRDRRALEQVCALIGVAERAAAAALPGFAELGEMLLDRATVDFPDHTPLHMLARGRGHADPGVALERLERLAESHRMDPRGRARLYLGLAATLSDEPVEQSPEDSGLYTRVDAELRPRSPRRKFLRDLAGYHANEPAIFGPLREALRQLGAFTELFALFDAVAADAEQWLELAEDAGAAGDQAAEAVARRRAGNALFERVMTDERSGGGLGASTLDRACAQLARAIELEPGDAKTEYEYGRALERAGRFEQAFALLVALIDEQRYAAAGVELGLLARRCGLLAIEIGANERAAALLRQAYDALPRPRARISVAERLFELLVTLARAPESSDAKSTAEAQAQALARELAELVEVERARAMSSGDPGALAGLDPLPWLERAARLASDEQQRAELYAKAHALAPDDERLADAYEASLRAIGRNEIDGALASLLRRRIANGLQAGDRARTVAQLERLLALLDPLAKLRERVASEPEARERIRDRAELLEQLLRLAPDRLEPRLELASLRLLEGDREAAAGHWRMLAQRLPIHDRRFLEPARALARFAIDSGELEQARAWLERARAIEPDDRASLEQLLEVARGLDEPELVLSTSALLLEQTSPHDRAALLRERARAYERLEQPGKALSEIREAAAVSEPGSDDHVEAARQWLRLATRDGVRVLLREDQAKAQAEGEAEARAELRRALGQQLPPRAYIAEAELLAERLGQRAQAIALLFTGLARHLGDADLLATYEELCTVAGEQRRFVGSLAELLATAEFEDPGARVRLGEKLARSARAIDDPHTCLAALEALPGDVAERPELLELRDWAVRGLGGVDEELARLDERILALDPGASPERLQTIVTRMLRLLGDAGEPVATRLLGLADTPEIDPELARSLARSALRVAREYAPERLEVAIAALRASLQRESVKAVAALWPGVESLALETNDLRPLVELLALALAAEREGEVGYGRRADRLASAALRLAPGDPSLHEQLLARVDWRDDDLDGSLARVCASLDGFAQELELRGAALAQMWSAALARIDALHRDAHPELGERLAELVRSQAELAIDTRESFDALLELLRARDRWDLTLELLLRADQRHANLELAQLEAVAEAAAARKDTATQLRACVELGTRRAAQR